MFPKIFMFEIQNRIRKPAFYLYFSAVFLFTIISFATGALPAADKEHLNSPYLIAFWCAAITMMMMLISSSVMGPAIYRDIEYQTKDYYLTYPITKPGYFWGRYLGALVTLVIIALGILLGIYLGSIIGPITGKTDAAQYGPNRLAYYLYPFFTLALPNLFFTASLFFGLVAITRNIKVIYFGGILLSLFYFIALFFLNHTTNATIIGISDPFGLSSVRYQKMYAVAAEQNNQLVQIKGPLAINRILWPGLGLVILLFTYARFNFSDFFSGKQDRSAPDTANTPRIANTLQTPAVRFNGRYHRSILSKLVQLELLNILRDNYFRVILGSGSLFLGFVLWLGQRNYNVPDLPRTVSLLSIFNEAFPFFIFFIILFYTGETLQRDRLTRYAFINDALPPPNWILNGSKLIPLLILAAGLSFIPLLMGVTVQLLKGFTQLNLSAYFSYMFVILMPRLLLMVFYCYCIHVIVNNKFAAHAIAATLWITLYFLDITGIFNYHLWMYSFVPGTGTSDMDGMGHMVRPISWFNLYWFLAGGLLIIVAALFYYRGVHGSFKERLKLIPGRFDKTTRIFTVVLAVLFLATGAYIYYNVSYLNSYLTKDEQDQRGILYEKTLRKYQSLTLPKISRIQMKMDLYPDKQQAFANSLVTIVNKSDKPIRKMLLDGDQLSDYNISIQNKPVPFTCPLIYDRGSFNLFRPKQDTAPFRLYQFLQPLAPGDSAVLEIRSAIVSHGFTNSLYSAALLHNGTFLKGAIPGWGYDEEDEISSPYVRKKAGLPPKEEIHYAHHNPLGRDNLKSGSGADLLTLDLTLSTAGDQTAISHGALVKQWQQNGRNYFHYVQDQPGMYMPVGIISARLTDSRDSIMLDHPVYVDIYHHPAHTQNTARFTAACKDGLRYYSQAYGPYPFSNMRIVETSIYGPEQTSTSGMATYAEFNSWHAHFTDPNQFDYLYFKALRNVAQQWWRFQVAPNNTEGSLVIPEGLANYDALVMTEKKYGKTNMRAPMLEQLWYYLFIRRRMETPEKPLLNANEWFEWSNKASVVLYGLRNLIGEDSINNALRTFKEAYAFRDQPPFAGANDLYRYLQMHIPDSLQYYLRDTWEQVTNYDNRIETVTVTPLPGKQYRVAIKLNIDKVALNEQGKETPVFKMNDYIDIGVFAPDGHDKNGRVQPALLYYQRHQFTRGQHSLSIVVKEKPQAIAIDPFATLVDRDPNDNIKKIE